MARPRKRSGREAKRPRLAAKEELNQVTDWLAKRFPRIGKSDIQYFVTKMREKNPEYSRAMLKRRAHYYLTNYPSLAKKPARK